jgi:hypothetical protein
MGFGVRLWRLWRLRTGVAASLVLALFAAVWSLQEVSLVPPGLKPRSLEMATASTHVVVDTPRSTILDLRQNTYGLEALTNRAVLLGNVMANGPARESIATRAGVSADALEISAPLTPDQPQARADSGNQRHTSDILASNDQYRLSIQANPTVPVLDIYSQAPTAEQAERLANAAVDGLRTYLQDLAATKQTPEGKQIQLVQLGRARGAVVNEGVRWQVALLAFFLTFGVACATVTFLARVKRGWRLAAVSERTASA